MRTGLIALLCFAVAGCFDPVKDCVSAICPGDSGQSGGGSSGGGSVSAGGGSVSSGGGGSSGGGSVSSGGGSVSSGGGSVSSGGGGVSSGGGSVSSGGGVVSSGGGSVSSGGGDVGPTLLLWLRSDVGVMTDSTGNVIEWRDQSGNGNHATPCEPAARPKTTISGMIPAVTFDGYDDCLAVPSGFDDFTTGLSSFIALKLTATTNVAAPRFWDFGTRYLTLEDAMVFVRYGGGGNDLFFQNYSGPSPGPYVSAGGAVMDGTRTTYAVLMSGGTPAQSTSASLYVAGQMKATSPVWVPKIITRTSNLIGRSNLLHTDSHMQGDVWELRLYRGRVSESTRVSIEQDMKTRWGL